MPIKSKPQPERASANQAGFVARLQLVATQWPSADRLAKATGVSPSAFRKWLKGEAEPSRDRLVALAGAAGVNLSWLAQGEGPEPELSSLSARAGTPQPPETGGIDTGRFLILPKAGAHSTAGNGNSNGGPFRSTEYIGFHHDWLRANLGRQPGEIILETAVGESMEPNIRDGDLLIVDTTDQKFLNYGIYVLEMNGERLVKRVQRKIDGSVNLISDNQRYLPETIAQELASGIRVIGRVIWRGGAV